MRIGKIDAKDIEFPMVWKCNIGTYIAFYPVKHLHVHIYITGFKNLQAYGVHMVIFVVHMIVQF